MAGSYSALFYHLVFSVKDRQPLLAPEIAPRVHTYLGGIVREIGGTSIIVGGTADHVHLLASVAKTLSVADALRQIKAGSSRWIHQTFPQLAHFAWQEGYGAFSVSVTGVDRVKQYILTQPEHHRTVTFQEEFLEFLQRHQIAYDERYLWR